MRLEIHELKRQTAPENTREQQSDKYPSPETSVLSPSSNTVAPSKESATNEIPIASAQRWSGIEIPDIRTGTRIRYGPLSSVYFGARLGQYLAEKATQIHPEVLLPGDIARLNHIPSISAPYSGPNYSHILPSMTDIKELSRIQEEQFLDIHWQSFHCLYPIISDVEFKKYYDSLWDNSSSPPVRNPSSLVDSILSICMQYGSTFLISDYDETTHDGLDNVKVASQNSHALYRRSQSLLLDEIENPSMMTLQSQIYCIIYLYNISSLNAAYALLGNTLRTFQMIGLQPRSLDTTSVAQQHLRDRAWSVISMLDNQLSMMLGRDSVLPPNQIDCEFPGHGHEHASLSGSMLISPNHDDITWLSFHTTSAYLVNLVQNIQKEFQSQFIRVQEQKGINSFYDSPVALEELAGFLGREVKPVYEWAQNVPQSLRIPRKSFGDSFSTERTSLQFDSFCPIWLQRQRLLLEMLYHHLQLSNFRSFLRLPPGSSFITPLADCHSINCLNHSISLTNIIHQVLTDTDLLRGWPPTIQYQWDSALCILGFTLTNPVCPPSPVARKCLQTAINSFEIMGKYFPVSEDIAQLMRRYANQSEILVRQFHNNLSDGNSDSRDSSAQPVTPAPRSATTAAVQILAAPSLTPEYIQKCPSTGFDLSNLIDDGGGGYDAVRWSAAFPLDDFTGASPKMNSMSPALPYFSADFMSEIDRPWVTNSGTTG